jgi:hypothetical protein
MLSIPTAVILRESGVSTFVARNVDSRLARE